MVMKGSTWSAIILRRAVVLNDDWFVLRAQSVPKKHSPHHYTTVSRLDCWHKAGWVHGFRLLKSNSDPTICCLSRNADSSGLDTYLRSLTLSINEAFPPLTTCFPPAPVHPDSWPLFPGDREFHEHPIEPVRQQQSYHWDHSFSPFWCLIWTLTEALTCICMI